MPRLKPVYIPYKTPSSTKLIIDGGCDLQNANETERTHWKFRLAPCRNSRWFGALSLCPTQTSNYTRYVIATPKIPRNAIWRKGENSFLPFIYTVVVSKISYEFGRAFFAQSHMVVALPKRHEHSLQPSSSAFAAVRLKLLYVFFFILPEQAREARKLRRTRFKDIHAVIRITYKGP